MVNPLEKRDGEKPEVHGDAATSIVRVAGKRLT
jgi:hypothetical protein